MALYGVLVFLNFACSVTFGGQLKRHSPSGATGGNWNIPVPAGAKVKITLEELRTARFANGISVCRNVTVRLMSSNAWTEFRPDSCKHEPHRQWVSKDNVSVRIIKATEDDDVRFSITFVYEWLNSDSDMCGHIPTLEGGKLFIANSSDVATKNGLSPMMQYRCVWSLKSNDSRLVNLTVADLNTRYSGEDCKDDKLIVYDGPDDTYPVLGTYCGHKSHWSTISSSSQMLVILSYIWPETVTFRAQYSLVSNRSFSPGFGVYKFRSRNGVINSDAHGLPSYSFPSVNTDVYLLHILTTYGHLLRMDVHTRVALRVTVYDGPKTLLARHILPVSSTTQSGAVRSSRYISSSFQSTVEIHNFDEASFNITFSSTDGNFSACKGINVLEDQYSLVTLLPTDFRISGRNVGQCVWYFRAAHADRFLRFSFQLLNLTDTDNCAYEGVVIFDGPNTSVPSYGPFCRKSSILGRIVTTTAYLTVLYYSVGDFLINSPAVNATIEETVCKGHFLTEENLNFQTAVDACYIFQKIPEVTHYQVQNIRLTVEKPATYFTSLTIETANIACGDQSTFSCSEHFKYFVNLAPCVQGSSLLGNQAPVNDTFELMSFVSQCTWSRAGFSAKVVVKASYGKNDYGECLKLRNADTMIFLPSWNCGLLTFSADSTRLTFDLINCQKKDYSSHIELVVFYEYPCDISFKAVDNVYKEICQRSFNSGTPRHSLDYLYYLRCGASKLGTRVTSIAADYVQIILLTNYYEVAIDYNIVRIPSLDVDNFNTCRPGYVLHKDFCYQLIGIPSTWMEGDKRCKEEGGELVSILDEDEYTFILDCMRTIWKRRIYAYTSYNAVFIGFRDTNDGEMRWTDNNPLIYTRWYSPGDEATTYTQAKMLNGMENDLRRIINDNQRQPLNEPSSRCTLMIVRNPHVGASWFKIPCSYVFRNTKALCKQPATSNKTSVAEAPLFVETPACLPGWAFMQGSCYRLVTSMANIDIPVELNTTVAMCRANEGASLAAVNSSNIDGIRYLLQLWKHRPEYGAIWISETSHSNYSVLSSTPPTAQEAIWGSLEAVRRGRVSVQPWKLSKVRQATSSVPDPSRPLNVLCEKPVLYSSTSQCSSLTQMSCSDGTCISIGAVCDMTPDCPNGEDEQNCERAELFFRCGDGRRISMSSYCDFITDCKDGSDESNCTFPTCSAEEFTCKSGQCIPKNQSCDFLNDCFDRSDETESNCQWIENCEQLKGFRCFSGDCIASNLKHNLRNDCPGQVQEDELFSKVENARGNYIPIPGVPRAERNLRPFCPSNNHVRCQVNNPSCFNRANTCIYNGAAGCGDKSHLKNCEHFQCKGLFKCPSGYCIPKHRVCDGTWDCTGGSDESFCSNYTCPGDFRCRGERRCLTQSQVCDGVVDCKYSKDDERFCDLTTPCPSDCKCLGYILICENTSLSELPSGFKNMREILFSGNELFINNFTFSNYSFLGRLDLSNNQIRTLPSYAFRGLLNLFELILKQNILTSLNSNTFNGLSLNLLDLQMNNLKIISVEAFNGLKRVGIFKLQDNNDFLFIHKDSLQKLKVSTLLTDSYRFCCPVNSSVNCKPEKDPFSSCSDMIANNFLRVSLWVLGVFAFVGNLFVFIWRLKTERDKAHSIFLINLALSDFLMGVYMLLIASVDAHFVLMGEYYLRDPTWRNSTLCRLAGVISFVASEMSVYTLVIITIDRVIVTVFVFKVRPITKRIGVILMVIGWLTWLIMATLPFYAFGNGDNGPDTSFYGGTSVCLPFTLSTEFNWISVSVFIIFNFVAFLMILVGYLLLYINVRSSAKKTGRTSVQQDIELAKKLSLIIFSDFCCWLPIMVAGLMSVTGYQISPEFSAWVAVFIMPLNSALNPYIYTLSTFKRDHAKRGSRSSATSLKQLTHKVSY